MMAPTFAIPNMIAGVSALFAFDGADVPNLFGKRQRDSQPTNIRRIIWLPGDDRSGKFGRDSAPRDPGIPPRSIATTHELCTVYIHAADVSLPELQLAQYIECRTLYDAWRRAIHLAAHGTYEIVDLTWHQSDGERTFGRCARVLLSVQSDVPDMPYSTANGPTNPVQPAPSPGTTITIDELDHSQVVTV